MQTSLLERLIALVTVVTTALAALGVGALAWAAPQLGAILATGGAPAEDSLYSCLLNTVGQGVPIKQAIDDCAIKLVQDARGGFGSNGIPGPLGEQGKEAFDPATITGACAGSDPTVSQSSGWRPTPPHGSYSWGVKGEHRDQDGNLWKKFNGYSEEKSRTEKEQARKEYELRANEAEAAIKADLEAEAAYNKAVEDKKPPADIAAAKAKWDAARKDGHEKAKIAVEAGKDADADPNVSRPDTSLPSGSDSACTKALQAAREVLRECNRVAWKSYPCQALHAKINDCPDPALILVDPTPATRAWPPSTPMSCARRMWLIARSSSGPPALVSIPAVRRRSTTAAFCAAPTPPTRTSARTRALM